MVAVEAGVGRFRGYVFCVRDPCRRTRRKLLSRETGIPESHVRASRQLPLPAAWAFRLRSGDAAIPFMRCYPCTSAISHTVGKGRGVHIGPANVYVAPRLMIGGGEKWKLSGKGICPNRGGRGSCLGEAVAFPGEPDSGFRNKQNELAYYLCLHMKDERSGFFDSVL